MSVTTVHFVRHGETDWNAEGRIQGQAESRLSLTGRKQAQDLRDRLPWPSIGAVYASDLRRTRETAEILLEGRDLSLQDHRGFREIALGPWEGQLWSDVSEAEPEPTAHFWGAADQFNLPGAEDFGGLQRRGLEALEDVLSQHQDTDILIVSHGAIIACILAHFETRPLSQLWAAPRMVNCAHSTIEFNSGKPRILRYANLEKW